MALADVDTDNPALREAQLSWQFCYPTADDKFAGHALQLAAEALLRKHPNLEAYSAVVNATKTWREFLGEAKAAAAEQLRNRRWPA